MSWRTTHFILLLSFLLFLVPGTSMAYPRGVELSTVSGGLPPLPFKSIVHTVKENETIWDIARFFETDLKQVVRSNNLRNPDLIFPGDRLVIEIRNDNSVLVRSIDSVAPPSNDSSEPLVEPKVHVTYPSKVDIFAPENPLVVYESAPVESLEPRRKPAGFVKLFETFHAFIDWLSGSHDPYPLARTGERLPSDSSSNNLFLLMTTWDSNAPLNRICKVDGSNTNYSSIFEDSLSPPPKRR